MEKAKYFQIEGHLLRLYIKIPLFSNFYKQLEYYRQKYSNEYENYLGESIDKTGKYIILDFALRNKRDLIRATKKTIKTKKKD